MREQNAREGIHIVRIGKKGEKQAYMRARLRKLFARFVASN